MNKNKILTLKNTFFFTITMKIRFKHPLTTSVFSLQENFSSLHKKIKETPLNNLLHINKHKKRNRETIVDKIHAIYCP